MSSSILMILFYIDFYSSFYVLLHLWCFSNQSIIYFFIPDSCLSSPILRILGSPGCRIWDSCSSCSSNTCSSQWSSCACSSCCPFSSFFHRSPATLPCSDHSLRPCICSSLSPSTCNSFSANPSCYPCYPFYSFQSVPCSRWVWSAQLWISEWEFSPCGI